MSYPELPPPKPDAENGAHNVDVITLTSSPDA